MRRVPRLLLLLAVGTVALLVSAAGAAANHATRPHTDNMQALGHSPDFGSFLLPDGARDVNSDLAFWRNQIFHGDYDGFRILRGRGGNDPTLISRTRCNGDQGDIVVWRDILVRAWNAPKTEARNCDGTTVEPGFEGMHVFDISNRRDPELVADIELSARPQADSPGCGTHTLTLVPDRRNDRVIIYNATSGGNATLPNPEDRECNWIDIVEVSTDDPEDARWLRREPLMGGHAAHDNGVILGDVNKLASASGMHTNVFDIGRNEIPGGSLEDPNFLYMIQEPGVCNTGGAPCNGHRPSPAFTWDGEVIILGWEPGGGTQPECETQDPAVKKSAFFYDADDARDDGTPAGTKLGQWTLPRDQSSAENCTIHNYNIVPLRDDRYVMVGGHYQAGTWVVDFTNPASPRTLGWSDPPPAVPTQLGGAWSSYWYNGLIYESEIQVGLNVFRFTGREARKDIHLKHLNPQTQEFTIDSKDKGKGKDKDDDDDDDD